MVSNITNLTDAAQGGSEAEDPLLRRVYWSELGENATKFDRTIASTSDQGLKDMWLINTIVTAFVGTLIAVIFLSIVASRRARKNPFNIYILCLLFPDFVFAAVCCVSCAINYHLGRYVNRGMCLFQAWYLVFGWACNSWLNAAIAHEIHRLLRSSSKLFRYRPPTRARVLRIAAFVYAGAMAFASLILIPSDKFPHKAFPQAGYVCLPVPYDLSSNLFFYLCFIPLLLGIPYGYVAWVVYDIFRSKLLPPPGKRRQLSIFFFRIILVFVVMWGPATIVFYGLTGKLSPWVTWSTGLWAHMQGLVSACLSIMKPDLIHALKQFVTCQCWFESRNEGQPPSRLFSSITSAMAENSVLFASQRTWSMRLKKCRSSIEASIDEELGLSRCDDGDLPVQKADFTFGDEARATPTTTTQQQEGEKSDRTDVVRNFIKRSANIAAAPGKDAAAQIGWIDDDDERPGCCYSSDDDWHADDDHFHDDNQRPKLSSVTLASSFRRIARRRSTGTAPVEEQQICSAPSVIGQQQSSASERSGMRSKASQAPSTCGESIYLKENADEEGLEQAASARPSEQRRQDEAGPPSHGGLHRSLSCPLAASLQVHRRRSTGMASSDNDDDAAHHCHTVP